MIKIKVLFALTSHEKTVFLLGIFSAPHQPRLDWQMWFAALGNYQHNPWLLTFCYRLLTGQPEVLQLIKHNPFPEKPPQYLRAKLHHYHYTSPKQMSVK